MAKKCIAKIKAEDGRTVFIEIEDPNSDGASEEGEQPSFSESDESFSFTDADGKRLTITIAE